MLTDPIADMLTRIRNGYLVGKETVTVPFSKMKEGILKILVKKQYLAGFKVKGKEKKQIKVDLLYKVGKPAISHISRVSKGSRRIYKKAKNMPIILSGYGLAIISTPEGLMTNKQARKKKLGGEIVLKVW